MVPVAITANGRLEELKVPALPFIFTSPLTMKVTPSLPKSDTLRFRVEAAVGITIVM